MRQGVSYLDASLASSLYLVVVVLSASWTSAGTLPQEVKRASITCSCWTGAARTHRSVIELLRVVHLLPISY